MTVDVPTVNALDPAFIADPHRINARLRSAGPVARVEFWPGQFCWLVTRYDDVRQVLADQTFSSVVPEAVRRLNPTPVDILSGMDRHMLQADPPDHTRLRRLVSAALTPRRIEALRPRIGQLTTDLLDAIADRDEVDLLDEVAFPLPIQVIFELVGVPDADRASVRTWSNAIIAGGATDIAQLPAISTALVGYLRGLVEAKRAEPADDLLSALIGVHDADDRLTSDELTSMVFLLLLAGHETTTNLISTGTLLLLSEPGRWQGLRADPSAVPDAIEELMRYESPVHTATFRIPSRDVSIGGQPIKAGEMILVSLLSANRDTDHFAAADALDLGRRPTGHLAFGHGIHYCIGAPLARMEARIALTALLERFPAMTLAVPAEDLTWRPGLLIRGLTRLPVRLGARSA